MRRAAAVTAAGIAARLSRRLGAGGGTALPGLIAERIDPGIVRSLAGQMALGSVLVTGTNGKTTTSRLLRNIVAGAGMQPVANAEGSNMMRGIAAALAGAAGWRGDVRSPANRAGVFEVDEATLPLVAREVAPRAIVFTNLFRDQLDRYGEVDTVASLWQEAVRALPEGVIIVINGDDPSTASLGEHARGRVIVYGLDDPRASSAGIEHAADARWCRWCGAELGYTAVFYGHIGHWACDSCGSARPRPDVACVSATPAQDGMDCEFHTPAGEFAVTLPLQGLYNVYNALAAAAGGVALGLDNAVLRNGLAQSTAAFGRQERLLVQGRQVEIILAKNPAGLNQVLRTIRSNNPQMDVAFFLNDRVADGRDISWIWDVDFDLLAGKLRGLTVSGRRAWDMALRLKYAGLADAPRVEPSTKRALRIALGQTPEGETLYVIPTYTAMLEVRNVLGRWAGRGAFWQGESR